jgi:riboflavin synthase
MFTGIIETMGTLENVQEEGTNKVFSIRSAIGPELHVDQSLSHDGVCLTVVDIKDDVHRVVAIKETLDRSNLGTWSAGDLINLERCTPAHGRFDGHIVQGHVDQTAEVISIIDEDGSWVFRFRYQAGKDGHIVVPKGSVTINGVSLTVVDPDEDSFAVAIIPYTMENTVFKQFKVGSKVNLEFDIIGKYVARLMP